MIYRPMDHRDSEEMILESERGMIPIIGSVYRR